MRNDVGLADDARRRHAKRLEDPLGEHVAVESSRHLVNDDAEQKVPGVAVVPPRARRELERECERESRELLFGVILAIVERPDSVIGDAGRVREQMAHRDRLPRVGRIREKLLDRIGECELAGFDLQHHSRRSELLSERARLKDRLRADGHRVLDVRKAVPLRFCHGSALDDADRDAGDVLTFHLGADERVDAPRGRIRRIDQYRQYGRRSHRVRLQRKEDEQQRDKQPCHASITL